MITESPCKIEFTPQDGAPVTLVDVGGWMVRLPSFKPQQEIFEATGVKQGESWFKPLGSVLVAITFAVHEDQDTMAAAQAGFLDAELAGEVELLKVTGSLVITGDTTRATYPAVITDISPGLPFGPVSATTKHFQVTAGLPVIENLEEIS